MDAPKKVMPGEVLTARSENELRAFVKTLQITKVVGGRFRRTADGTILVIGQGRKARGGGDCGALAVSITGAGVISVAAGFIDGNVASGSSYAGIPEMDGSLLTATPAPTLTATGAGSVYAKVTWEPAAADDGFGGFIASGGSVDEVEIIFSTSAPSNTAAEVDNVTGSPTTNGVYHWRMAVIGVNESVYSVTLGKTGNRDVILCGDAECRLLWSGC
jgi:hypothetical protein